jgi:integrase
MSTQLKELVTVYATVRGLSARSAYQVRRTIAVLDEWLGRAATVEDLDDVLVSRWLEEIGEKYGDWTLNGHRTRLLCLWRFASRRRLVEGPGEVRRCPAPAPMPEAWTVDEVSRLVAATGQLPGVAGPWFHALILAGYESGLRRGDLFAVRREQIQADGILLRQHKTGQPHLAPLRPETVELVMSLPGECPLACPWGPKHYGKMWAKLRRLADVPDGCCQRLRRTGATWIAATEGMDAASRWLGHQSPEMVRHYVDLRYVGRRPSLPPRVGA